MTSPITNGCFPYPISRLLMVTDQIGISGACDLASVGGGVGLADTTAAGGVGLASLVAVGVAPSASCVACAATVAFRESTSASLSGTQAVGRITINAKSKPSQGTLFIFMITSFVSKTSLYEDS